MFIHVVSTFKFEKVQTCLSHLSVDKVLDLDGSHGDQ